MTQISQRRAFVVALVISIVVYALGLALVAYLNQKVSMSLPELLTESFQRNPYGPKEAVLASVAQTCLWLGPSMTLGVFLVSFWRSTSPDR